MLRGDLGLQLVAGDDPTGLEVHQEHLPRRDAPGAGDAVAWDIRQPRLGAEDHQVVVGDPVAQGAQAVAVQAGAHLGAVGEHDGGRAVPRLLQRGVELVERAQLRIHGGIVLPRLGDQHHQRVGQGAPAEVEQLERLVQAGRVGAAGSGHRQQAREVLAEGVGGHHALGGEQAVAVADHGVDLAVVGDGAEGVRERPGREGVGRDARVDDRQLRGEPRIAQVEVELVELGGGEHPLVDHHAGGQ